MSGAGQPIQTHTFQNRKYTINPKHRGRVAKSDCTQWVVSEEEELNFFDESLTNNFNCASSFFWWALDKDITPHLGVTDTDKAYIAKFVSDNNDIWHGYPVTGLRKNDIPDDTIIKKWKEGSVIKKKYIHNLMIGRGYV
ncbi:hypothetical protein QMS71_08145 [Cronobacter sakazakii]|nr:hypothetical protein [Cronobacter sakazakii]MDK1034507.1 hypothetical protein [Cronobacter sakazakii]MDK1119712.1 hypothetical protein [Cronobacter sakazakii]